MEDSKIEAVPEGGGAVKFGAFRGVFVPSILTILGVIMYLRLGWVVGNVGLTQTLIIVTISTAITFLTGLSMSATATNMKVGGGGAYYMISRSFGVEAGAAIGLPLFLAQALGISFYIAGFAESINEFLPFVSPKMIGVVSLVGLTVLAYLSADLALKAQLVILAIIVASIISFLLGSPPQGGFSVSPDAPPAYSFWVVFAVFFPAVTGIEAGMAMSGDLKNPSKALPLGTISAIVVGYIVYMALPILLVKQAPLPVLRDNPAIMQEIAIVGVLIVLGVWAATLSSALGALLGAPRTLQALAKDRVVPTFLGKESGKEKTPQVATAVSFLIALAGILLGDLNLIAPILSMFFLTSYGFLNLSAFVEGFISNPSWRPSFRTPWYLSLAGTVACFATMFMINSGATFVAGIACSLVFYITLKRNLNARWADIRRGIVASLARYSVYRIAEMEKNFRSWRPNILVLGGALNARMYLIELADAFTHGQGFLTVGMILTKQEYSDERRESLEKTTKSFLEKKKIPVLTKVVFSDDVYEGARGLLDIYGLGALTPNTLLMGESEKEDRQLEFVKTVRFTANRKKNLIVVRQPKNPSENKRKKIDVWWGGERSNAGLMLALAYMLQTSPEWSGSQLTLKTTVREEAERHNTLQGLKKFVEEVRVNANVDAYVTAERGGQDILRSTVSRFSKDADLVFIGMRPPGEEETDDDYCTYYRSLLASTEGFPMTAMVLANEPIDFKAIFV